MALREWFARNKDNLQSTALYDAGKWVFENFGWPILAGIIGALTRWASAAVPSSSQVVAFFLWGFAAYGVLSLFRLLRDKRKNAGVPTLANNNEPIMTENIMVAIRYFYHSVGRISAERLKEMLLLLGVDIQEGGPSIQKNLLSRYPVQNLHLANEELGRLVNLPAPSTKEIVTGLMHYYFCYLEAFRFLILVAEDIKYNLGDLRIYRDWLDIRREFDSESRKLAGFDELKDIRKTVDMLMKFPLGVRNE